MSWAPLLPALGVRAETVRDTVRQVVGERGVSMDSLEEGRAVAARGAFGEDGGRAVAVGHAVREDGDPVGGAAGAFRDEAGAGPASSPIKMSARKALERAENAIDAGLLLEALRLYEVALANSSEGSRTHARALFGVGMLHLHTHSGLRDLERGRRTLESLNSPLYNDDSLHVGALVALALVEEAEKAAEESARLREALAHEEASCRTDKEDLKKQLGDVQTQLQTCHDGAKTQSESVQTLEREKLDGLGEIEKLRAEIAEKDKALASKNAALRKMKRELTKSRPTIRSETPK